MSTYTTAGRRICLMLVSKVCGFIFSKRLAFLLILTEAQRRPSNAQPDPHLSVDLLLLLDMTSWISQLTPVHIDKIMAYLVSMNCTVLIFHTSLPPLRDGFTQGSHRS